MFNYHVRQTVKIRHWLPILTYCPVNSLPDLIYVTLTFEDQLVELYTVRKTVRKLVSGKKLYMEEIASTVADLYTNAIEVKVTLMFGRHEVTLKRIKL